MMQIFRSRLAVCAILAIVGFPFHRSQACQPVVTVQPVDVLRCANSNGAFSCVATGASLSFAWQVDDGLGFASVVNGGFYGGANTATLTVSGVSTTLNGYLYRCLVTNTCGAVTSLTATLRVSDPPATSCTPTTVNTGDYGTGIDRVQFGSIDLTHTANANDGLSDFSCQAMTIMQAGSTNLLTVTLNGGNSEYCQAYIDFDGDGVFTAFETVLNSGPGVVHTNWVVIPQYPAVADRLLRMRVISDFSSIAGPCNNVDYGEIEDFAVYIPEPPCGAPVVTAQPADAMTCAGNSLAFTCAMSGSTPTYQWQSDYGAGFINVTNGGVYGGATLATLAVNAAPASLNLYRYRCVISNACGMVVTTQAELRVNQVVASCSPSTVNSGNFGTGIIRFQFNTIDNVHDDSANDGSQDFTCTDSTIVATGATYAFTVTGAGGNPEYCRIYIDYNNDGAFAAGEIVYNNNTTRQTAHTGNITIPSSGVVLDAALRMRVITDFSTIIGGCNNVQYGEVEDYGVYIRTASPQRVTWLAAATPTSLVVRSAGPHGAPAAEYTTNLVDPNTWLALPGSSTVTSNGTNITTFGIPAGVPAAVIRFP